LNGGHLSLPPVGVRAESHLDKRLEHVPICVEQRVPAAGSGAQATFCNLF
jgi:hypothetical protein